VGPGLNATVIPNAFIALRNPLRRPEVLESNLSRFAKLIRELVALLHVHIGVASSTAFRHTAVDEHDVARRTDADARDAGTSAAPSQ
jgi:hypothetical protein